MLSKDENELLPSLEDNPTKPVRLMGEYLVLYRDKSGTLGLVDRHCLYRRADPTASGRVGAAGRQGHTSWEEINALEDVVGGLRPGRQGPDLITLLKTVGTAAQDKLPAFRLYQLTQEVGVGMDLGTLFPRLNPARAQLAHWPPQLKGPRWPAASDSNRSM